MPKLLYYSWSSQGKNTKVVCHSLLQWTTFCQTSPPWPVGLGWPHTAWLSFIELDKAVVLVWLDWLVFCDYGFSVSVLSQHLPSYCNNLLKKYIAALLRLARGHSPFLFWCLCQKLSLSHFIFYYNSATQKLLSDQAWSSVPKLNLPQRSLIRIRSL